MLYEYLIETIYNRLSRIKILNKSSPKYIVI